MTPSEILLEKLLHIPSPSGKEFDVAQFIVSQLDGLAVRLQEVDENRFNVIATKGTPRVWLVAHMDTVPGIVPVRMTETAIYGRGACDNKQSIAGAIVVARELEDIGLLFTVGEETDFAGAKKAEAEKVIGEEPVIIQEPTKFVVKTGYRGVMTCNIKVTGVAQHSALPNPNSAIMKLAHIMTDLETHNWTGFNAGLIHGGTAANVVPALAETTLCIRPDTKEEYDSIHAALAQLDASVVLLNDFPPNNHELGFPRNVTRGFSELAFFKNSIEFGAGDGSFSHTDDEHILRADVNRLPEELTALIKKIAPTQLS